MSGFNCLLVSIYYELVLTHCSANSFFHPPLFSQIVVMSEYESGGEVILKGEGLSACPPRTVSLILASHVDMALTVFFVSFY